jgi:hypothetical protein
MSNDREQQNLKDACDKFSQALAKWERQESISQISWSDKTRQESLREKSKTLFSFK